MYSSTQYGAAQYEQTRKSNLQASASPRNVFMAVGVILLMLLCVVPIWNAIALLTDSNYTYWVGSSIPWSMIAICVAVITLYCVTITTFFRHARPQVQTEQTIMMIANIFITLLGLALMLASLPLSRQAADTYNNLMHRCDYSEQTHRMYEYSQVLQNIRALPDCATKFSVEECGGYEDAKPYTTFLKKLENDFRCSGFCYRSPVALQAGFLPNQTVPGPMNATATLAASASNVSSSPEASSPEAEALMTKSATRAKHMDRVTPLALLATDTKVSKEGKEGKSQATLSYAFAQPLVTTYPPTLFSDANYQASCEGMAARDMKNFAGDIGFQTFYQGIYLVLIAIATGFLKLIGFCVRKDKDVQYADMKAP